MTTLSAVLCKAQFDDLGSRISQKKGKKRRRVYRWKKYKYHKVKEENDQILFHVWLDRASSAFLYQILIYTHIVHSGNC